MLKNLKQRLTDYTDSFTMYDYAAFGWLLFLLAVLILLALLYSKKKPKLAASLIFFTFTLMLTAPMGIKIFLDSTIRKVDVHDQNHTLLNFSKALVVTGNLKNLGKIDIKKCYIQTKILKETENKYLNILYNLKPIRKRTTILDENISQNSTKELKIVFEKFNYQKAYRVTQFAECY